MTFPIRRRYAALLAVAFFAASANAAVFKVGADAACDFASIQAAVDAAAAAPGHDIVRIARNPGYVNQQIGVSVALNQELTIEGGYATCASEFDGGHTVVAGTGGQSGSRAVFDVYLNPGARVHMHHLHIRKGHAVHGGGIRVSNAPSGGASGLDVSDSVIIENTAVYGGGIHAHGGQELALTIGPNVMIARNTAEEDGGGVHLDGDVHMNMTAPNSTIAENLAGALSPGGGGGIMVVDGATVLIGSTGQLDHGAISFNEADYGAGIAVGTRGRDDSRARNHGRVVVRATDPAAPPRIHHNVAHALGGAFYLGATDGSAPTPRVDVANVNIEDNRAPAGAVLSIDDETSSPTAAPGFSMNVAHRAGSAACAAGVPCNGIRSNVSVGADFLVTGIHADVDIRNAVVQGNQGGGWMTAVAHPPATSTLATADSLVTDNRFSVGLFAAGAGSALRLGGVTLANNAVTGPGGAALRVHGDLLLERSILWQPGLPLLDIRPGATATVRDVLASDIASLGSGAERVVSADPRFVDVDNAAPSRRDYHLQAASPAVDFAVAAGGIDLGGQPRDRDLPLKPDQYGPADLGAYERQSLAPLVRNGDFDRVLDLWRPLASAGIAFDASDNAPGSSGGSLRFGRDGGQASRFEVARQCVFLPGPGIYRLNGWGRTAETAMPSTRDSVVLRWELRLDGGEQCDGGAADLEGDHLLSNDVIWQSPAEPACIDSNRIFDRRRGQWSRNASIAITLVVIDRSGSVSHKFGSGWFDAITLEPGGDTVFADGFEPMEE